MNKVLIGFLSLSIVVLIILLLTPGFLEPLEHPKYLKASVDIKVLADAIVEHEKKTGELPSNDEDLGALLESNIVYRLPSDPWGYPYAYSQLTKNSFFIYSVGSFTQGAEATILIFSRQNGSFKAKVVYSNDT
jgi:hypothetical protein